MSTPARKVRHLLRALPNSQARTAEVTVQSGPASLVLMAQVILFFDLGCSV